MPTQKIDPKVIFASDAPAIDKPPVFSDKTKGWDISRANDGRPEIKQMNKMQQDTDLKILWLNENAVLPYDLSIDYPDGAVAIKDGSFKQLSSGSWVEFLDDFADKDAVKRGIANRYDSSLTYNTGERVVLINGDIVKSTIDGNANDPNVDMTGWVYSSLTPSNNLSDVADKAESRTNLDVYSKAETDSIAATPDATETVAGKAKIATTAIVQAGTNDTDFITALKLKNTVFGLGQNRKVVTKISGTTYTNTTGKPVGFEVIFKSTGSGSVIMDSNITVNLETRQRSVMLVGNTDYRCSMFVIILPNESYSFNAVNVSSIEKVTEIS